MSDRPLRIGISSCFFHADPERAIFKGKTLQYTEQKMAHWIMASGALAWVIPSPLEGDRHVPVQVADLVRDLDGVVLQGGSDVAPESYGEPPIGSWLRGVVRDRYEIALVNACLEQRKPLLGVCRGHQVLNVALGGTLYQDIATQRPDALTHRDWSIYESNGHDVDLHPGSRLAAIYGASGGRINSIHHQAVKDLGEGLRVEARSSEDGIIEAIWLDAEDTPYMLGVQWHPEFQDPEDDTLLSATALRDDFLTAARQRRDP